MILENGYETKTTFIQDFQIAEAFGIKAIKDTFKRAFKEWKSNIEYITELSIATNTLCWYHHLKGNNEISAVYADCYAAVQDYVYDDGNFTETERQYYFDITD